MTTETQHYFVGSPSYYGHMGYAALRYAVCPASGLPVDYFKTQSAALYAASLLNRGVATVNPHAVVGCRIEAKS